MNLICIDWSCECGLKGVLRRLCYMIGYMNLVASVIDIVLQMTIIFIVTGGLECDVDRDRLEALSLPCLEPFILLINLGTHGFFPFPLIVNKNSAYLEYMSIGNQTNCYPGMIHLSVVDVLNFLINVIWLRLVISYVTAVYRKDQQSIHMFLIISTLKLVLQTVFFVYQQKWYAIYESEGYWILQLADILLSAYFLIVIHKYIKELRNVMIGKKSIVDHPPSYIECLIRGQPLRTSSTRAAEIKDTATLPVQSVLDVKTETPKT